MVLELARSLGKHSRHADHRRLELRVGVRRFRAEASRLEWRRGPPVFGDLRPDSFPLCVNGPLGEQAGLDRRLAPGVPGRHHSHPPRPMPGRLHIPVS